MTRQTRSVELVRSMVTLQVVYIHVGINLTHFIFEILFCNMYLIQGRENIQALI